MDDVLVAATSPTLINKCFLLLKKKYKVKRLGFPSNFLGWKITKLPSGGIHISQPAATEAVLERAGMASANGTRTPYLDNAQLHPPTESEKTHPVQRKLYQQLLGELRHTDSTRPDLFFVISRLSTAAATPTKRHWAALKRLLRYLRGTSSYGIYFSPHQTSSTLHTFVISGTQPESRLATDFNRLESYSDADYSADPTDRKSISGIIHIYNGAPVHWTSNKQSLHPLSACEAEYVAATSAAQQTLWLRRVLADMNLLPQVPTTLYLDSTSAIRVVKNTGPTKRRKYIDLRHHYLHGHILNKRIIIKHVSSRNMLADILTKPLRPDTFTTLVQRLNIVPTEDASRT